MEASPPAEVDGPGKRRCVEIFGIHELILKPKSKSGYKDVYPLQRKKRPWQAKVWEMPRDSPTSAWARLPRRAKQLWLVATAHMTLDGP